MKLIKYLFALFIIISCSQSNNSSINNIISNSKTSSHINIPGTRIYMKLPNGFSVSNSFTGIQKGNARMTVYDLPGGNFNNNAANFNKEGFEKKGIKLYEFREVTVNGFPGRFVSLQRNSSAKSYGLVFGDTTFSAMIMSFYPSNHMQLGNQLIEALNSIYYDKNTKVDPFVNAKFSLNDSNSSFKFLRSSSNIYIYTLNGKENKNDKSAPFIMVTQLPLNRDMGPKIIADMMIAKSKQYGLTNPEIKGRSDSSINGYHTYQSEIYGYIQNSRSIIYECVLANSNNVIVYQGIAKNDLDKNLREFKRMVSTVRIK